jgi:hypothetical protein
MEENTNRSASARIVFADPNIISVRVTAAASWKVATRYAMLLLAWSLLVAADSSRAAVVKIGTTSVNLPTPETYVDCSQEDDPVRKFAENFCPKSNRLLGVFASPDFRRATIAGETASRFDYTLVEISRALVSKDVSASDFAELKGAMKGEQEALLKKVQPELKTEIDRINRNLKDKTGDDISLKVEQPVPLGVFAESDRHVSMAMLMRMQVKMAGKNESSTVAVSINLVNVKGKVLYLYGYRAYSGAESVKQLKQFANAWVAKTEKANTPE